MAASAALLAVGRGLDAAAENDSEEYPRRGAFERRAECQTHEQSQRHPAALPRVAYPFELLLFVCHIGILL